MFKGGTLEQDLKRVILDLSNEFSQQVSSIFTVDFDQHESLIQTDKTQQKCILGILFSLPSI